MLSDRLKKFEVARERLDALAGAVHNKNEDKSFLDAKNGVMAERLLHIYLKNCFYVNEKIYSMAREIIEYFQGMTELRYPNEKFFIEAIHKQGQDFKNMIGFDEGGSINPICLTGRAGDGKSEFIDFVDGLFNGCAGSIENVAGRFRNLGWDRFSAEGCSSAKTMLSKTSLVDDGGVVGDYSKICYVNGIVGFFVDELQFTTKSKAANSKITAMLLDLRACSVPWVYICNYSLIWKLLERNQEDVDRIIPKVFNFCPFGDDTPENIAVQGVEYVEKLLGEIGELFPQNLEGFSSKLVQLTCSSPRYIRDIISIANRMRFDAGSREITIEHLDKAYRSSGFVVQRHNVELLNSGSDYLRKKNKLDLVLPPQFMDMHASNVRATKYIDDYRILVASLTKSERNKFGIGLEKNRGKVVTLREISKAERLKAGYRMLDYL